MVSMTFGVMPSEDQFDAACERTGVADEGFSFGNDRRVGNCVLSARELWRELQAACEEFLGGDDAAGDWCSSVLGCLGFEWV